VAFLVARSYFTTDALWQLKASDPEADVVPHLRLCAGLRCFARLRKPSYIRTGGVTNAKSIVEDSPGLAGVFIDDISPVSRLVFTTAANGVNEPAARQGWLMPLTSA
jgi:hypothetical protein